jgi:soluble lytic murein transglycosylase
MSSSVLLLLVLSGAFTGSPAGVLQLQDTLRSRVLAEYEDGRYWHGVRLLDGVAPQDTTSGERDLLLLAQGNVGWGDWEETRNLLEGELDSAGPLSPQLWYYLGRAREGQGEWEGAADAYASALEENSTAPLDRDLTLESELRLGKALGMAGRYSDFQAHLTDLLREEAVGADWLSLLSARRASEEGAMEDTRVFLSQVARRAVREMGWDLPAQALLVAGDSVGAEAAYWSSIPSLSSRGARQRAWGRVGALRLARGDSVGAKGAFHQVLLEPGSGSESVRAATGLLSLGFDSVAVARRGAEALAGSGRDRDALVAWGVYEELRGGEIPLEVSLGLARIHLRLREPSLALERLAGPLASPDPATGAPGLVLQAQSLRALGRGGEARGIQDTLMARFPNRAEAVEVLFLRADALQDRGDFEGAMRGFQATSELSPTQNLAGQARMRMGMIRLSLGGEEEAVELFDAYREDFPEGRRWDEAAFWSGRTLLALGREEEGRELLNQLRSRFSLSYYTVMAGKALGEEYQPRIPERETVLPFPQNLKDGLARLDLLRSAGLDEGAAWEVDALREMSRELKDEDLRRGVLLRLGLELNRRGLTREGINLGWEVQRLGEGWSRDLLAALYPFPYRDLVFRGAEEAGLDPYLMAGLMRQESAFWKGALSRADARGLMQVLPATGAELARARGPRGFDADEHLYRPEVNIHLGMNFFSDLRRRFGEDLSILLSAYNAGPTRALRWREYPEAGDLPRFVERIPFSETRGYVKNVLLNREIYAWLYGPQEGGAPEASSPSS